MRRLIDELDVFRVNDRAVVLVGPTREKWDYGRFRFYYEEWAEGLNSRVDDPSCNHTVGCI